MSKGMLGNIPLSLVQGPVADLMDKLAGKNGDEWLAELKLFLRKKANGIFEKKSVICPAVSHFVASDFFQGEGFSLGDNFQKNFLGKTEKEVPKMKLRFGTLEDDSLDKEILEDLDDRQEIPLAHFAHLLRKQSKGEEGILLKDGCANVLYVRDVNGSLWAVCAYWSSHYSCWYIGAGSIEYPDGWIRDFQVIDCVF